MPTPRSPSFRTGRLFPGLAPQEVGLIELEGRDLHSRHTRDKSWLHQDSGLHIWDKTFGTSLLLALKESLFLLCGALTQSLIENDTGCDGNIQ